MANKVYIYGNEQYTHADCDSLTFALKDDGYRCVVCDVSMDENATPIKPETVHLIGEKGVAMDGVDGALATLEELEKLQQHQTACPDCLTLAKEAVERMQKP